MPQRIEQTALSRYYAEEIREPAVVCIDPLALAAFQRSSSSLPWLLLEHKKHILNVISLEDYAACLEDDQQGDAMCWDADSELRLVVVLVTSQRGEVLLQEFQSAAATGAAGAKKLRIQVVRPGLFSLIGHESVAAASASSSPPPLLFTLTMEPCFAPSPYAFGKQTTNNAFDLDLQEDVPADYRAKLKRIATTLHSALTEQLVWDVEGQIFSMGFGASLLGNTIGRMLPDNSNNNNRLTMMDFPKPKASLLIMDRPVDWAGAFSSSQDGGDGGMDMHRRLHSQLARQHQSGEILPHIVGLVRRHLCSKEQAFGLAVHAASRFGAAVVDGAGYVEDLADALACSSECVRAFLNESAAVKQHCAEEGREEDEAGGYDEEEEEEGASLLSCVLAHMIKPSGRGGGLPRTVRHVDPNPAVLNNVLKLFGGSAVAGAGIGATADSKDHALVQEFRRRARVVVFVLGGVTRQDVQSVARSSTSTCDNLEVCLIGTSLLGTNADVERELWSLLEQQQQQKQHQPPTTTATTAATALRRNFAELFS